MVEAGGGWYLRGDLGYSSVKVPIGNPPVSVNEQTAPGPSQSIFGPGSSAYGGLNATVGAGYQFNNWFRSDATFDWRQQHTVSVNSYGQNCAIDSVHDVTTTTTTYQVDSVTGAVVAIPTTTTQTNVPYLNYANDACYKTDSVNVQSWTGLLNAYGDLGHWFGLTPYVGAGAGITHIQATANEMWYWDDGKGNYGGAGVNSYLSSVANALIHYGYPGNNGPTQICNNFSWALMAGVSYDLAPHLKLDIGYRYLNMGIVSVETNTGAVAHKTIDSQEVRAGLRWTPDL